MYVSSLENHYPNGRNHSSLAIGRVSMNTLPIVALMLWNEGFKVRLHKVKEKAKIFFDVCHLFSDLFNSSLIFFAFAPYLVWIDP